MLEGQAEACGLAGILEGIGHIKLTHEHTAGSHTHVHHIAKSTCAHGLELQTCGAIGTLSLHRHGGIFHGLG